MIPGRYAKNREALQAILDLAGERGIAVLVYLVPLRNDVKVPYDSAEYAAFKDEVAAMAARPGVRFANLVGAGACRPLGRQGCHDDRGGGRA